MFTPLLLWANQMPMIPQYFLRGACARVLQAAQQHARRVSYRPNSGCDLESKFWKEMHI